MAEGGISDHVEEDPESFIISNVMDGVQQSFVDSGVDMEVLTQLERLWVSKLKAHPGEGLSLADVLPPPQPVKKTRARGKGRSNLETPSAMEVTPKEEIGGEKEEHSDVIVISSDSDEPLSRPGPAVSIAISIVKLKAECPTLKGLTYNKIQWATTTLNSTQ